LRNAISLKLVSEQTNKLNYEECNQNTFGLFCHNGLDSVRNRTAFYYNHSRRLEYIDCGLVQLRVSLWQLWCAFDDREHFESQRWRCHGDFPGTDRRSV
jgi:hypothetical protein